MRKILVTGSAGFIGMHLCLALQQRGDYVLGYDHFNPYYSVSLKRAREELLKKSKITTIDADICDSATFRKCLEEHGITHVVHLAAQAGVRYSLENPQAYLHSNVCGFVQILEELKKRPHIPLIYASSSSIPDLIPNRSEGSDPVSFPSS